MIPKIITFICSIVVVFGLSAQALTIDTTFQPFFDIRCCGASAGMIGHIWESPITGKLYLVGDFEFSTPDQVYHGGITSMHRDGSRNYDFKGGGSPITSFGSISYKSDSVLLLTTYGNYVHMKFSGQTTNHQWRLNYLKTIHCARAYTPYFYADGSTLMSNSKPPNKPDACKIVLSSDTFPHRYIVKIDPQGFWDSTFTPDANEAPDFFSPYDSNRIWVQGNSGRLTHYDGKRVNGLFRIYEDGKLDTSFQLIMKDTLGNAFRITHPQKDGSFFMVGKYFLKEYPNQTTYMAKFHPNGMVDTSFKMDYELKSQNVMIGIGSIASTPDGGYIIAGSFDSIQGYPKHNLAKLDSVGKLEPEYFNTHGADTSHWQGGGWESINIKKSALGGYYIYGDFISWNGKPTQPIIRLKELSTGINERESNKLNVKLFPNPTTGFISIVTDEKLHSVNVYNLQGQKVQEINPNKRSWELPKQNGLYLIRIQAREGSIHTKKIIKN